MPSYFIPYEVLNSTRMSVQVALFTLLAVAGGEMRPDPTRWGYIFEWPNNEEE